ncbi:hypothetical protein ACQZV8_03055 [Magnetococcales bacterium HHB-1]
MDVVLDTSQPSQRAAQLQSIAPRPVTREAEEAHKNGQQQANAAPPANSAESGTPRNGLDVQA